MNSDKLNVTVKARLRRHLAGKAKSTNSKILARYYSWQRRALQQVAVEGTSKIAGVQGLINDVSQLHYLEPKLCYDNALTLTTSAFGEHKVGYVEGFVVVNESRLFPHAWNSTEGRYFDYTRELANDVAIQIGKSIGRWQYFKVIELSFRELYSYTRSCRVPIQIPHFRKQYRLRPSNSKILWRSLRDGSESL